MSSKQVDQLRNTLSKGFTLIELLVSIAILGVVIAIAAPDLSYFSAKSSVDNQISELHRLILTARNTAVNTGKNVTICPLSEGACTTNWQNELSVFTNTTDNAKYTAASEELIKTKAKIPEGGRLKFNQASLIYTPSGRLISGNNSLFIYCSDYDENLSRGINISLSGRIYASQDTDGDDKDEDRDGNELSCN